MPKNSDIKGFEFAPKAQSKLTSVETSFSPSVSQTRKVCFRSKATTSAQQRMHLG